MSGYSPNKKYNLFEILQKADEGDLEAMETAVMVMVAERYLDDNEDSDVSERYVSYLRTLAESGMGSAYIMLADNYLRGRGVPKDPQEAMRCYEKAVETGISFGNECIGMMFYEGKDVPANYEKAFEYFHKNEEKKSFCTVYSLGEMYRLGLYVEKNEEKACEYYNEIVYGDDNFKEMDDYYWRACYRLAQAMHYGKGIDKNIETALDSITKAKKQHHAYATDITLDELNEEWVAINQDAGKF